MIYPIKYISITNYYHTGKSLDFGWSSHHNQDIFACDNGYILKIDYQKNSGGNVIYIKHDNGIVSAYAHLLDYIVKVNQRVILGEKIGRMGATGKVTGEHLHFGLYSKEKANKGFNKNGLYGNADINPFDYLYVYNYQEVNKKTLNKYDKYIKYYDDFNKWTTGKYELLFNKYIRTSCNIPKNDKENCVKVKECMSSVKPYLTSNNPNDYAVYKKGTIVNITEIIKESNNRIWGKLINCYIVLCNKDGSKQAEKR